MNRLAIAGARLIDGTGAPALPDSLVLVEEGRIAWVGTRANAPGSLEGYAYVDAKGQTLLPGLINCHVHLTCDPGPQFYPAVAVSDSPAMAALRAARNARLSLEAGETTVRDMGAKGGVVIDLARAIAQGIATGPRIVAAGAAICMTGGHGWFTGREADGPDGVRQAVREQLKAGATVIKLMATGGVMTPGIDVGVVGLSENELAAGIEEAHNAGRKTATHAIGTRGINNALRAGIDSVEHGTLLDEESVELFLKRGAFLVPTLSALDNILRNADKGEMAEHVIRKTRQVRERAAAGFRLALAAGVRVGAGTDASTPYNPHGGLVRELELMVAAGCTPMQALRAATGVAAELLGLADEIGTIEVGKQADLILVDGDPLADIGALRDLRAVLKDGRVAVQKAAAGAY